MTVAGELLLVLALTLLNGLFTGAEIALLSVRRTRLQTLADAGSRSARAALRLRQAPDALLATLQIGITVIGATTAVIGGARLEAPVAATFSRLGLGRIAEPASFVLVVSVISYFSLVVGELVPKSIALRTAERYTLLVAVPLGVLSRISRPLVWLLTASSNVILRPLRDQTTFSESRLSPDELQQLVEESASAGSLHPGAGEIASRAIDLGRLKANALMVPRTRIVALEVDTPDDEIRAVIRSRPHARYPVYEDDPERVLGYVRTREVFEAMLRGAVRLRTCVHPVLFFPETASALDVLRALQAARQQLALLVDEHGGVAGLLSIEDVAEDLLGEILEEDEKPDPAAWVEDARTVSARGEAALHEVERLLDQDVSGSHAAATVSGLLIRHLGRWPETGERVVLTPHVEAEIVEASPGRVHRVRFRVRHSEPPP